MKKIYIILLLVLSVSFLHSQETELERISQLYEDIKLNNSYISNYNDDLPAPLPLGLKKTIAGQDFTIIFEEAGVSEGFKYVTVSMIMETPDDKSLAFRGEKIKYKDGAFVDAKLLLVSNHSLDFDSTKIIIKGDEQRTWVEFDCKGYKRMHLQGEVIFDKNKLQPDDKNLQASNQPVRGYFEADVVDFNNLLLDVSIEPFQVKGLKDFGFSVQNAVFDYSSVAMK